MRIAGRWFPRALLVDVNVGHLNLAEAVLDMSGGEPLATSALLKDVAMPDGVNPKLAEFSLNYALQDDKRFDEVGPAGQVLWCLYRLEPDGVRDVPSHLRYLEIEHDHSLLDPQMLTLENQLDDELSKMDVSGNTDVKEVTVSLIYPHLRAGTFRFRRVSALCSRRRTNRPVCALHWWTARPSRRCRVGSCLSMDMYMACAIGINRMT